MIHFNQTRIPFAFTINENWHSFPVGRKGRQDTPKLRGRCVCTCGATQDSVAVETCASWFSAPAITYPYDDENSQCYKKKSK